MIACYAIKVDDGVPLPALRVRPQLPRAASGDRRVLRRRLLGKNILGSGFSLDIYLHRGAGGLHLRRRDRADRKPGRQAGLAADQAAVPRRRRRCSASRRSSTTSRRSACVTHILDRGVDWFKSIGVPPDPNNPRDAGSYGPKLYCLSGHVNKPGCYEAAAGHHRPRADRRTRRRRLEGPQGQGRRFPAASAWAC